MAKIYDITDKLDFNTNPKIVIKGQEIEINNEATTMLKIMGEFSTHSETEASINAAKMLFGEEGLNVIENLKLSMKDFMKVIELAMNIAMEEDGEDEQGEVETHTTT